MDNEKLQKRMESIIYEHTFNDRPLQMPTRKLLNEAKKDFLCRVYNLKAEQIDEEFMDALRSQVSVLKEIKAETELTVNSEWLLWFFDWFMGDKKE